MKVKLILLATLTLSWTIQNWAAEKVITNQAVLVLDNSVKPKESKKSFFSPEGFEIRPYYSVLAESGFRFTSAAIGTEVTFNINKHVGITLDAFGKDNVEGPVIDRAGIALTTTLPLNRSFALYGQGGFGYWTGDVDEFDMILRVGLKYKFNKTFSIYTDVGQGVSISGSTDESGSYQQIRVGAGISF